MKNLENLNILSCIEVLRNISSTNEKIKKIKEYFKEYSGLWVRVLVYAYDPLKVFHVKKYKKENIHTSVFSIYSIFPLLNKLSNREITGHAAVKAVENMRKMLSKEDAEVFDLILQKDLKCGINKKLIQKALGKDTFFEIGYMGAVPYDEKKVDRLLKNETYIISQEKMDGEYCNLVIEIKSKNKNEDEVSLIEFYSRSNKVQKVPLIIKEKLKKDINEFMKHYYFKPSIYNGELMIDGYDRYTSNGLLARIFKLEDYIEKNDEKKIKKAKEKIEEIAGDTLENVINNIKFHIWDYQDSNEEYYTRIQTLVSPFNLMIKASDFFRWVDTKILINQEKFNLINKESHELIYKNFNPDMNEIIFFKDIDEAKKTLMDHFNAIVSNEGEGTIVKSGNAFWKKGKPVFQIKYKFEFECELRIKGFKQGNPGTKFENALGAFKCSSEDGVINCVPSGIAEDLRFEIWENQNEYLDKIITVKCNGLSKTKEGTWSLLHPRFIKFRGDKEKADNFDEIKEIQDGIIKKEKN